MPALSAVDQEKARRQYVGNVYALGSSLYVTDFFGDQERLFVDARPFDIVDLYHHGGGKVPIGAPSGEIIPAGTPVKVVAVQYPVDPVKATFEEPRSELAPTAHTWLVLERADPGARRTPLVMVLPRELSGIDGLNAEVVERLKSDQWVTQWLTERAPLMLSGIMRKEPAAGMTWAELQATLGLPKNAKEKARSDLLEFVADYGDLQVTLQGTKITAVSGRKAEALAAAQGAQAKAALAQKEAEQKTQEEESKRARAEMESRVAASVAAPAALERRPSHEADLKARLAAARKAKNKAEVERLTRIQQAEAERAKAERSSERLRERANAEPRDVGASVTAVDPQLAAALGVDLGAAFVTAATPGSEAAAAGLAANDIVTSVNDIAVKGPKHFGALVASAEPHQRLELAVLRRGAKTKVVMGTEPGPTLTAPEDPPVVDKAVAAAPTAAAPAPEQSSSAPAARASTKVASATTPPTRDTPAPATATPSPSASAALPWWRDQFHFGIGLHYVFATTAMDDARRWSKQWFDAAKTDRGANATLFGFAHGAELMFVVSTPWIVRAQVGAAGLYDLGSVALAMSTDPQTGQPLPFVATGTVTGHAWAATVPVLVGGRLPFLDRKLAATVDLGTDIVVASGLSYEGGGAFDDWPAAKVPGVPFGFVARAGATYHIIPQLAVVVEGSMRRFHSPQMVYRKHPEVSVVDFDGKPVSLDFSGFGGRVGLAGYFF